MKRVKTPNAKQNNMASLAPNVLNKRDHSSSLRKVVNDKFRVSTFNTLIVPNDNLDGGDSHSGKKYNSVGRRRPNRSPSPIMVSEELLEEYI